jgi:DNA-binding protein H-NS
MQLRSMSLDKLVALKNQVEAALSAKVTEERRMLQEGLSKLSRFQSGVRSKPALGRGAWGKVAPKYCNPENPAETWAGRGLKPRWVTAAIKAGHKLDDFLIAGQSGPAKAAMPKRRNLNGPGRGRPAMRGSGVPPKYRNPDNPSETWAGRGLKPRWLTAALKKPGKKLEHFSIAAPAKRGPAKMSSKAGK